ncbi:MAG: GAF domain-containing protein [Bacteroidota bacterium]
MGVKRSLLPWKEDYFDFKYQLNMESDPDQNLRLSVSQGLCGEAYREQTFKYVSMVQENPPTYNLSADQREKTKHLKTIISVPIWEIFSNEPSKRRVIGVLNIDSKQDLGESLFNETIFKDLTNKANFIGMIPIL